MASKSKKAAKVETLVAATAIQRKDEYVDPAKCVHGRNSRDVSADPHYKQKVTERAVSIFLDAQQQPADGFYNEAGELVIYAGHTRMDAVALIREGFDHVNPVTGDKARYHNPEQLLWVAVDPGAVSEEDAYLRSVTENFGRDDLNPIQEAIVYETLRQPPFGWTDTRIANHFGRGNTNRVSKLTAVREKLGDKYQGYVAAGRLGVYPAFDLIAVPAEERDALLAKAMVDPADPESKFDGSVIRGYLQNKQAEVSPETGGGEEGSDDTGGDEGEGEKTPRAPKRNAKDLEKLAASYKGSDGSDEAISELLNKFIGWFACKRGHGDQALLNALARFKNS